MNPGRPTGGWKRSQIHWHVGSFSKQIPTKAPGLAFLPNRGLFLTSTGRRFDVETPANSCNNDRCLLRSDYPAKSPLAIAVAPTSLRTLKLTIAYDGTAYAGWQFQLDRPTVQGTLEDAIAKVTGQRVRILASGRTDAGVHALGQVVGFRTDSELPPDILLRALNANLPHDIAVLDVAEAPEGFHPICHVLRKRYRYTIHDGPIRSVFSRQFAWHYVYGRLDAETMKNAAKGLLGTHDFSSFETSGAERKTSIRTIFDISVERGRAGDCENSHSVEMEQSPLLTTHAVSSADDFISIEVEADGFLYNMVRTIVGTLVQVGRGSRPVAWPTEVLQAKDRRAAGPTAPPQGLCLVRVEYDSRR
jgi:tRNA pseudouridine38-40 synthase